MGVFVIGAGLIAFATSILFGSLGFFLHLYAVLKLDRGSWLLYVAIALVVGVSVFAYGEGLFLTETVGAPTEDDYMSAVLGAMLVGGAPGMGLLLGALAVLRKKSSSGKHWLN